MKTRFAYSTNAYTAFPLSYAIYDIKRCGFDGVEVLADVPHANPVAIKPETVRRLQGLIERLKLGISNVNANTNVALDRGVGDGFSPSLVDPSRRRREQRIRYLKAAIDLTHALGGANIAVSSGRLRNTERREDGFERMRTALGPVLEHAERRGVRIGVEYEPGLLIEDCASLEELFDRVPHPLLGANLDIGHAQCAGENVAHTIRRLGKRIWNFHVEDIRQRVHDHLVPGEGDLDFGDVLRAIGDIKYTGYLTLELYPYKERPGWAGRTGLEHLRSVELRS